MRAARVRWISLAAALLWGASASPAPAAAVPEGAFFTAAGSMPLVSPGLRTGMLATDGQLRYPEEVLGLPDGSLLVADDSRIWRVGSDGRIRRFAAGRAGTLGAEGGPATSVSFDEIRDLARLPDGSILVVSRLENLVRRIYPDRTVRTVAGLRHPRLGGIEGYSGDGGPATRAKLDLPMGLAALPDGGFLVADMGNDRVRRVSPDGLITTVAGNGRRGHSGDGGPATQASIDQPVALAVQPDGGFLIAEGGGDNLDAVPDPENDFREARVLRVAPDGTISTVARLSAISLIATDDGGFLAEKEERDDEEIADRIVHVDGAGQVTLVAGGVDRWSLQSGFASIADGAPPLASQMAIGISKPALTAPRALEATFDLTQPATVVARALRRGRVVRRTSGAFPAGRSTMSLGAAVRPGDYQLNLTATSNDGLPRQASDIVWAFPGGVLPVTAAARALTDSNAVLESIGAGRFDTRGCRRMGRARVDCRVEGSYGCNLISAVLLRPNGTLVHRDYSRYRCRFARHPAWSAPHLIWPH